MNETAILAGIAEVARAIWAGRAPLTPDMRLVEDLRLDSIRLLTLAAEVENRFRVLLDELDEGGIETVGDLVAIVRRKLGGVKMTTLNDWLVAARPAPGGGAPLRRPRRDGHLVRLGGGAGAGARRLRRAAGPRRPAAATASP